MEERISNAVFIGGCPRSGTTYLASLLANFNGVIVTPESKFKHVCYEKNTFNGNTKTKDILNCYERDFYYNLWGCDLPSIETPFMNLSEYRELLDELVIRYAKKTNVSKHNLWLDHTPSNFLSGNLMLKLYPNAKFIHIIRDPRAVIASLLKKDWGPHDLVSGCLYWEQKVSLANAFCAANPEVCMILKYEDLISNSQSTISRVTEFLNIDLSTTPKGELVGKFVVPDYSLYQHKLVTSAPDLSRIDGWTRELDYLSIKYIEEALANYFHMYNYSIYNEGAKRLRFYKIRLHAKIIKQKYLSLFKKRRRRLLKKSIIESKKV